MGGQEVLVVLVMLFVCGSVCYLLMCGMVCDMCIVC